jgi:hypothetical protein
METQQEEFERVCYIWSLDLAMTVLTLTKGIGMRRHRGEKVVREFRAMVCSIQTGWCMLQKQILISLERISLIEDGLGLAFYFILGTGV